MIDNSTSQARRCPRCGEHNALLADQAALDRTLARYYHEKGFGLIEVCMCADPRQLAVFWNNVFQKIKTIGKIRTYLVCPDCAFWQIMK